MILRGRAFAGERDLVDARMLHERRTGGRAVTRHDVDHAVRNAGLLREPRHPQASQRRLLGRLHDDRATSRQGRAPLPGDHQRRKVPRNDLADHADRLAPRVAEVVAADRNRLALNLVGPTGVVAQAVDHQRNVGRARVADRLAVVERFERRQLVGLFLDQVGQLVHQGAAIAGIHLRPRAVVERLAGRIDRRIDVGLVAFGHFADHFFGGRVNRFECLAAGRRHPLAADEALRLPNLGRLTFAFFSVTVAMFGDS